MSAHTDPATQLRPNRVGPTVSLLSATGEAPALGVAPPPGFADLHLGCALEKAGLFQRAVWHRPPAELATVHYRQAVVTELRETGFGALATRLVDAVTWARRSIDAYRSSHYPVPAELQLAAAIGRFAEAVSEVADGLRQLRPSAAGVRGLAAYLADYVAGPDFQALAGSTVLQRIRRSSLELGIQQGTVWADPDIDRPGWAEQIEQVFSRFREPGQQLTAEWSRPRRYLNHIEAQAIGLVAGLFPELFAELHRFVSVRSQFLPAALERLAEELRFYLDFLRLAEELADRGVAWCLPRLSAVPETPFAVRGVVDLALAVGAEAPPVANDLALDAGQQVVFVTGPNQGGKTTFARSLGQLGYLAGLGLPVPARSASLPWSYPVLTHFPAPDDPEHDRGGLADELHRLHQVMTAAGPHALLIFNELFSATSAADALQLSARVVEQVRRLGCRVVWVTFLEELVLGTEGAVSLVGQVAPEDPTRPTFRFRPQPPGGRSHAVALAARHGLSSDDLAERLR